MTYGDYGTYGDCSMYRDCSMFGDCGTYGDCGVGRLTQAHIFSRKKTLHQTLTYELLHH